MLTYVEVLLITARCPLVVGAPQMRVVRQKGQRKTLFRMRGTRKEFVVSGERFPWRDTTKTMNAIVYAYVNVLTKTGVP